MSAKKDAAPGFSKKIQNAWAMYDWANSVYSLVITTTIFPIFYNALTMVKDDDGNVVNDVVTFWGMEFLNTQLYSYVLACSFLVIIVMSPLLSGMADYAGKKLSFMKIFCYTGAAGCASMYFFNPSHLEWSMGSLFLANLGFWGSLGFYNAYLPEIAPPEEHDKLGARGYVMGYIGSVLLLLVCLGFIMGIGSHLTKWAFVLVGVWWVSWAQPAFRRLPTNPFGHRPEGNLLMQGFRELRGVARELKGQHHLTRYLGSFFVMSMAIQTIMLMATSFGIKEVKLTTPELIIATLLVQLVAIPGAFFVAWLSGKWGNVKALGACVLAWCAVCAYAYYFATSKEGFYVAAGVIGFMMGGTQSLNRSTYSKLLPHTEDHASYFSFYEVLEKSGLVVGMFGWGYIEGFTGSMRNSILALVVLFLIAFVVLRMMPASHRGHLAVS
jgi:UMF1 family MFS transporter